MISLETKVRGKMWVEILDKLPEYVISDAGRLVIDKSQDMIFFGGNENWRCLGLYDECVKKQHIYFNVDPQSEGVNASVIPTYFEGNTTDIQTALEYLTDYIYNIQNGTGLKDNAIKARHIDFVAGDIPVQDSCCCFGKLPYELTVEDTISLLCNRRADGVLLKKDGAFGELLPIGSTNVQGALENIEEYLKYLDAEDIPATACDIKVRDKSVCTGTNVQSAISNLCTYLNTLRLKDLYDVEDHYGTCHQVLHTCGYDSYCCTDKDKYLQCYWDYVSASYVTVTAANQCFMQPKGPGSGTLKRETNVQSVISELLNRHIVPSLCDTPSTYGPGGQVLVSNGKNAFTYYDYTILGLLDTPDAYQMNKGLKCDGTKMVWAPYIEKFIDLTDGPGNYGEAGNCLVSTGTSVAWANHCPSFIDGVNTGVIVVCKLTYVGVDAWAGGLIYQGAISYPQMDVKSIQLTYTDWYIHGFWSASSAFATSQVQTTTITSTMAQLEIVIGSYGLIFNDISDTYFVINALVLGYV